MFPIRSRTTLHLFPQQGSAPICKAQPSGERLVRRQKQRSILSLCQVAPGCFALTQVHPSSTTTRKEPPQGSSARDLSPLGSQLRVRVSFTLAGRWIFRGDVLPFGGSLLCSGTVTSVRPYKRRHPLRQLASVSYPGPFLQTQWCSVQSHCTQISM